MDECEVCGRVWVDLPRIKTDYNDEHGIDSRLAEWNTKQTCGDCIRVILRPHGADVA